ncbi:MAG: hypothetical protein GXY36_01940 [Chloroflexi bacterium]|jgi:hypothetical protein|nr:hypothetical protein [Chloroflexota bacterium]
MKLRVTEVEASFTPDGWPIPSALRWEGEMLSIIDIGRRWRTEDGIHLLVRVPDQRVFELHTNGSLWRAGVIAQPPHFA